MTSLPNAPADPELLDEISELRELAELRDPWATTHV
jgi:hypothetical protein